MFKGEGRVSVRRFSDVLVVRLGGGLEVKGF